MCLRSAAGGSFPGPRGLAGPLTWQPAGFQGVRPAGSELALSPPALVIGRSESHGPSRFTEKGEGPHFLIGRGLTSPCKEVWTAAGEHLSRGGHAVCASPCGLSTCMWSPWGFCVLGGVIFISQMGEQLRGGSRNVLQTAQLLGGRAGTPALVFDLS